MANKILIMGESGTGKSTSMRNFGSDEIAIVNPVGKPLPFRGKFQTLDGVTESRKINQFMDKMVDEGKKVIVVDDFQYILSVPYMNRIKEAGWDKWNDFGDNYFTILDHVNSLPDNVNVYFLTHTETLENGITTIKLIGKMLREKITIEGLFTIVLQTQVSEGNYYFLTQNSGKNTVKSPMGMFDSYSIENDLKYVDDKVRNYYYMDGAKSDEEIKAADESKAGNVEKPRERKGRNAQREERIAKERDEYVQKEADVLDKIANGRDEVPFDEVADAMEKAAAEEPKNDDSGSKDAENGKNEEVKTTDGSNDTVPTVRQRRKRG